MNSDCYNGKKVLVTGHSGFKGSWLTLWLKALGADVIGYSLPPDTEPALYNVVDLNSQCISYFGDIRDTELLSLIFTKHQPDIVFHLAAQPLVRASYFEPVATYETNVIGTLNVLETARKCNSVKAFVNITTDKCYENNETNYAYKEDDKMGGYDMYSSSKACSEILTASYRNSFLKENNSFKLASARAGNVIGGGDWAQDRLVPDCIRFINENKPIEIRNPHAIRPWQHVLEPLSGYLTLGAKLLAKEAEQYTQGFNFGPNAGSILTVADVAQKVVQEYGKGEVVVNKKDNLHEANLLMLNIEKAKETLGWTPIYNADAAIKYTAEWYKRFYSHEKMLDFTLRQINDYQVKMNVIKKDSLAKLV